METLEVSTHSVEIQEYQGKMKEKTFTSKEMNRKNFALWKLCEKINFTFICKLLGKGNIWQHFSKPISAQTIQPQNLNEGDPSADASQVVF